MTVRSLSALVLAAGVCLANPIRAKEPERRNAPQPTVTQVNQQLADSVAARLTASGVATGADVRITTQKGIVQLTGQVRSPLQLTEIVKTALGVPGVMSVQHSLEVASGIQTAQATGEPAQLSLPGAVGAPTGIPMVPFGPGGATANTDPIPLAPPAMPAYDPQGPQMPPYAWPTYAPYNNVSRVAYPQAYPYNAWPYIGPFYPFPKVPLGWRSVQLQWEDGHWYYGRIATPHDYWRVRFW